MVKRYGNLWTALTSPENIFSAYLKTCRGRRNKRAVNRFKHCEAENLERIRQSLLNRTFHTSRYQEKLIHEPKERVIYILPFNPDRIVQHALMNVMIPVWEKFFIGDTYACRVGLGMHAGSRRTMEYVRRNRYCLKCDISKFYPSIDQEVLMSIIRRKVKDPDVLWLLDDIVRSFPGGRNAPIGNFCSQWFGNLYLSELDHYVKSELRVRDYLRYCDDFCLFSDDKAALGAAREKIRAFLDSKLKLGFSKCEIFPVSHGIDFLGYRHFDNYVLLRKSTARRVIRRLAALPRRYAEGRISYMHFQSSVGSTNGWLKWARTGNLRIRARFERIRRLLRRIWHERSAREFGPLGFVAAHAACENRGAGHSIYENRGAGHENCQTNGVSPFGLTRMPNGKYFL